MKIDEKINKSGYTIVKYYADWCGPCRAMHPTLEKFKESSNVPLIKVDVDKESEIAKKYGIRGIPCFIVIEDGEIKSKKIGLQNLDQLIELVK